jgi:hypothetical protein
MVDSDAVAAATAFSEGAGCILSPTGPARSCCRVPCSPPFRHDANSQVQHSVVQYVLEGTRHRV